MIGRRVGDRRGRQKRETEGGEGQGAREKGKGKEQEQEKGHGNRHPKTSEDNKKSRTNQRRDSENTSIKPPTMKN